MALSSLDAVKGRIRHQTRHWKLNRQTMQHCLQDLKRTPTNSDIEIVAEDEQEQVKVHYIGYHSRYDEWKPSSEVVIRPPSTTTQTDYSPFDVLACMIKKQLVPSKTDM